jgi:hypothetical protein
MERGSDRQVPAQWVRQVDLPGQTRARCTLTRIDYHDSFLVAADPASGWSGEQWARAMLSQAPISTRATLTMAWRSLGLLLGSPLTDRHVLGWHIRHSTKEFALLGANGCLGMSAELLYEPRADGLLFATLVQLDTPFVRALWPRVIPAHLDAVRDVLGQACQKNHRSQ